MEIKIRKGDTKPMQMDILKFEVLTAVRLMMPF